MKLSMDLGKDSYDIVIERGALQRAGELLSLDRKVLVVTDSGVPESYANTVAAACKNACRATIPAGEGSKNMDVFRTLLEQMLKMSFARGDCVVAVGGGVVGDLSGFVAACYMRGVDFYNIPTTLLSQVDSSIGGKTAIDLNGVKNIVGAFYQPKKVLIDPDTLQTLDARQLSAGLAEAIKMGITSDAQLFDLIANSTSLEEDLPEIIERALRIKKNVVEQDPKESGLRKILNFGHTIGHAIESQANGELLHGESVAVGMIPMCSEDVRERLIPVLEKYHLPTSYIGLEDELLRLVLHDKKAKEGKVDAVFSDAIGSYRMQAIDEAEILKRIQVLTRNYDMEWS